MKRYVAIASAVILFQAASMAQAANIGFSINVGGPPIVISQPPDFLYPPELGFGVAVGVPYDMFYLNGVYFVFRGGGWYRTTSYGGEWIRVRRPPPEFRRYKIAQIHAFRDREYRGYARDRVHYRGQHFRPEDRGHEERREMRAPGHENQRGMPDNRHEGHGGGHRNEHGR